MITARPYINQLSTVASVCMQLQLAGNSRRYIRYCNAQPCSSSAADRPCRPDLRSSL